MPRSDELRAKQEVTYGAPEYFRMWNLRALSHNWKGAAQFIMTKQLTLSKVDKKYQEEDPIFQSSTSLEVLQI